MMSGSICTNDSRAVQRKRDRQPHEAGIVNHLVVCPLEKGGVNCNHRAQSFASQAAGEGHGVLFRDADVEEAFREALRKLHKACALSHGGGDGYDSPVFLCQLAHRLAEHGRVTWRFGWGLAKSPRGDIELRYSVEFHGQLFSVRIALAFLSYHVQQSRLGIVLHARKDIQEFFNVMAADGTYVIESKFFKNQSWNQRGLGGFHEVLGEFQQPRPKSR